MLICVLKLGEYSQKTFKGYYKGL